MVRPIRIEYPNAYYHVINRGNNRQPIFFSEEDMDLFLAVLEETHKQFFAKILAFCLMHNHYHLLIRTPLPNLQRAMRHLGGVYTQRVNKIHKRDGHLFKGRYRAILIQEEQYLRNTVRYIHLNPQKAGLVQDPADWKHSSHRLLLGDPRFLKGFIPAETLGLFGSSRKTYLEFMKEGVDPDTQKFYDKKKIVPFFGSAELKEELKNRLKNSCKEYESHEEVRFSVAPERVLDGIAHALGVTKTEIKETKRGRTNLASGLAMALLKEKSQMTHGRIAEYLSMGSERAVSVGISRFKKLCRKEAGLNDLYQGLSNACSM